MAVLESGYGDHGQPFASHQPFAKLGWIVRGVVGSDIKAAKLGASTAITTALEERQGGGLGLRLTTFVRDFSLWASNTKNMKHIRTSRIIGLWQKIV